MNAPYVPGTGLNAFATTLPPTVEPGPDIVGSGSPEGNVEAAPGTGYTDSNNNDLYVKVAGVQTLGWRRVGKSPSSGGGGGSATPISAFTGNGSPVGVVTPSAMAAFYTQKDSSPPGLVWSWYDDAWH
ncbi:MAG TPA: hypothetical protein VMQ76_12185 [Terracidiphilus sp.]|nr:hypothetical protein [Terracidiphilus sp.]